MKCFICLLACHITIKQCQKTEHVNVLTHIIINYQHNIIINLNILGQRALTKSLGIPGTVGQKQVNSDICRISCANDSHYIHLTHSCQILIQI